MPPAATVPRASGSLDLDMVKVGLMVCCDGGDVEVLRERWMANEFLAVFLAYWVALLVLQRGDWREAQELRDGMILFIGLGQVLLPHAHATSRSANPAPFTMT